MRVCLAGESCVIAQKDAHRAPAPTLTLPFFCSRSGSLFFFELQWLSVLGPFRRSVPLCRPWHPLTNRMSSCTSAAWRAPNSAGRTQQAVGALQAVPSPNQKSGAHCAAAYEGPLPLARPSAFLGGPRWFWWRGCHRKPCQQAVQRLSTGHFRSKARPNARGWRCFSGASLSAAEKAKSGTCPSVMSLPSGHELLLSWWCGRHPQDRFLSTASRRSCIPFGPAINKHSPSHNKDKTRLGVRVCPKNFKV